MKTKTRRQKRRISQHRRKKKLERRKSDTSLRLKNVNSRAIAFRLHAQMLYNNNGNNTYPLVSLQNPRTASDCRRGWAGRAQIAVPRRSRRGGGAGCGGGGLPPSVAESGGRCQLVIHAVA